ncbi:MAG: helix-turn-helix transcriptional regulator [Acidimicrobiia bacterium]
MSDHDRPPPPARITVALFDDCELVRRGLVEMLRPHGDRIAVVELDVDHDPEERVDVTFVDPYGGARLGCDRVASMARDPSFGRVAIYTWSLTAEQKDAVLAAGARGLVAKSIPSDELVDAVLEIVAGRDDVSRGFDLERTPGWTGHDFGFTLRESEVAALLANGLSNREIAVALWISLNTVKSHLKAIFQKITVTSRGQAMVRIAAGPDFVRRRSA